MGVTALLTVMFAQCGAELPISKRFAALDLAPWRAARLRRFGARMTVALGLAMTMAAVLLSIRAVAPVFLTLALAFYSALVWYRYKLKNEPRPLP